MMVEAISTVGAERAHEPRKRKKSYRIQLNLGRYMGERGILNLSFLARETGISRDTLDSLLKGTATRIEFRTLLHLCRYFDCTPGDLLEIVNEIRWE